MIASCNYLNVKIPSSYKLGGTHESAYLHQVIFFLFLQNSKLKAFFVTLLVL